MNVKKITGIRGCVFDAYGTLFDVNSAARRAQETLRGKWQELAELWRTKQLQYTWLRSLGGRHVDFWQLTGEALDFTLDSLKLENPKLREQLMELYLRLSAYPDVEKVLTHLKASGLKCAILSNGSPKMLASAVENAGIQSLLGFHVIWCNRFGQVPERIPETPDAEIRTLSDLQEVVGVS